MELSGLELRRKIYELRGWKHDTDCPLGKDSVDDREGFACHWLNPAGCLTGLPPVETSADISEALLIAVCRERGYESCVSWFSDESANCAIYQMLPYHAERIIDVDGATPPEARSRAILAILS